MINHSSWIMSHLGDERLVLSYGNLLSHSFQASHGAFDLHRSERKWWLLTSHTWTFAIGFYDLRCSTTRRTSGNISAWRKWSTWTRAISRILAWRTRHIGRESFQVSSRFEVSFHRNSNGSWKFETRFGGKSANESSKFLEFVLSYRSGENWHRSRSNYHFSSYHTGPLATERSIIPRKRIVPSVAGESSTSIGNKFITPLWHALSAIHLLKGRRKVQFLLDKQNVRR